MVTEGVNCDTWLFQPPPSCQRQIQQLGHHSWGRDTDVFVSCLRDLTMLAAVSITYVLSLSLWCTCTHTETCIIQSAALKTASINQSLHADLKISLSNILYFLAVNKSNEKYLYCSTVELHCCWKTIKNALVSYTAAMSGMFLLFCFDLISHACCIKYPLELQTCIKILPNDMLFPFENYSTERFFAFLATVAVRLCGFSCLSVG